MAPDRGPLHDCVDLNGAGAGTGPCAGACAGAAGAAVGEGGPVARALQLLEAIALEGGEALSYMFDRPGDERYDRRVVLAMSISVVVIHEIGMC